MESVCLYTIQTFEFNNLEQTMDPNIAKLQVIQNDMMRLLVEKKTEKVIHTWGKLEKSCK